MINQAYNKAIKVLDACSKPRGFYASGLKGGYEAIWSRDSITTALGASLAGVKFKKTIRNSLEIFAKNQTANGHIPNCVGSYNTERRSDITFNSIDAPLWFIIGHYIYTIAYNDDLLFKKHKKHIAKALVWLKFQDPNEDKLIVQQPTNDWMDAFPHKYGRVIHTLALYYAALNMVGNQKLASHIKKVINGDIQKYLALWDKKLGYYRPWAWKDHDGIKETESWFDCLGNLLAIVSGLADIKKANSILKYIDKHKVNRPYPCKTMWPPIKPGDKEWKDYFSKCDARKPLEYSNAGVWPVIGGFYIAALIKQKKYIQAKKELELLAKANLKTLKIREFKTSYGFNEWLHGKTGQPKGEPYQAWSAGAYIYAYECVKRKKCYFFD